MRGFPPLHVIAFTLAFALLAIPLSHLTFARPDGGGPAKDNGTPATTAAAATKTKLTTYARLRLAHLPVSLSVTLDGIELLPVDGQKPLEGNVEFETALSFPNEGIELVVTAQWPAGTPDTAVTLELEPEEKEARTQTQWSTGESMSKPFAYTW